MLEDVCLESVSGDPVISCVEQYFSCLSDGDLPQPERPSKEKARMFLATREPPEHQVGRAAEKGYWPFEHPAFATVKEFLRRIHA